MATLQHVLLRGIGLVFRLDEGEVLTEPVPSRDSRRTILAYVATEGGAGVLGRLATEPQALARVARTALDPMHYRNPDAAIAAADPALLDDDPEAQCVKGCYRCLLSYYNQPDHEHIDRTDDKVLRALLRLARGDVAPIGPSRGADEARVWVEALARWGPPLPDARQAALHSRPGRCKGRAYPSETFRVLNNEKARYGEYRTVRLVLAAWDAQKAQVIAAQ